MTDYEKLLRKYEKPVKGERYRQKYKQKIYYDNQKKYRHVLFGQLLAELPFTLTKDEKQRVRFFIDMFNKDFKYFHRQSKDEAIILAFIFLIRVIRKPKTNVDEFKISQKYGLNNTNFRLIICRLNDKLMESTPLTVMELKKDKHEYLEKGKI